MEYYYLLDYSAGLGGCRLSTGKVVTPQGGVTISLLFFNFCTALYE